MAFLKTFKTFCLMLESEATFLPISARKRIYGNATKRSISLLQSKSIKKHKYPCKPWITNCSYSSIFPSQSDKNFCKHLSEEIECEKTGLLPQPANKWLFTQKGAECKLSKTVDCDRVEVLFNVNQADVIQEDFSNCEEKDFGARPDFRVNVVKQNSDELLSIACYIPGETDIKDDDRLFRILGIVMHKGEISGDTYCIDPAHMNSKLNHYMEVFLEERGINNEFAKELIEISKAAEKQQYVRNLEKLEKFVRCA